MEFLIVRLLFADTAVALVVTGRPRRESVLRLDAAWHHTLPAPRTCTAWTRGRTAPTS
ncbi:hypothetical protein SALBM311S_09972 [Streptomyces alboniger]